MSNYMIGQRVILNRDEIGTVVSTPKGGSPPRAGEVWVHSPSRGYASCYSEQNVQPLPNGQL